jgi:hypothetical protein
MTILPVFCAELRDWECDVMEAGLRSDEGKRLDVRLGVGTTARDFADGFVGLFVVSVRFLDFNFLTSFSKF